MEDSLDIKIKQLRARGKTYSEIIRLLKIKIPKSTLSYICRDVNLPKDYYHKIKLLNQRSLKLARRKAKEAKIERQNEIIAGLCKRYQRLKKLLLNKNISKILLVCLYLAEGGKTHRGSLMFGNSDPKIIKLFLYLLRNSYKIDEDKFRCTLQCRVDQNIKILQIFWSKMTSISLSQFYKPQIDKRSLGKRTLRKDYKGVCRIDYFSAKIFHELITIGKIITE